MQYETKIHKIHSDEHKSIYAQWNGPSVTKPNPGNCKNCSSKCAYDCAQLKYTIQHRTVLIIFTLTSVCTLRCMCVVDGDWRQATTTTCSGTTAAWCCRWTTVSSCPSGRWRWRPVTFTSWLTTTTTTTWSPTLWGLIQSRYTTRENIHVKFLLLRCSYSGIESSSTVSRHHHYLLHHHHDNHDLCNS